MDYRSTDDESRRSTIRPIRFQTFVEWERVKTYKENHDMASQADHNRWIAERMRYIGSSGIRKVFELARSLKDPVNLSIGQPDFDVPQPIKDAAHAAIERGANAYTVTQGIAELRAKIQ